MSGTADEEGKQTRKNIFLEVTGEDREEARELTAKLIFGNNANISHALDRIRYASDEIKGVLAGVRQNASDEGKWEEGEHKEVYAADGVTGSALSSAIA